MPAPIIAGAALLNLLRSLATMGVRSAAQRGATRGVGKLVQPKSAPKTTYAKGRGPQPMRANQGSSMESGLIRPVPVRPGSPQGTVRTAPQPNRINPFAKAGQAVVKGGKTVAGIPKRYPKTTAVGLGLATVGGLGVYIREQDRLQRIEDLEAKKEAVIAEEAGTTTDESEYLARLEASLGAPGAGARLGNVEITDPEKFVDTLGVKKTVMINPEDGYRDTVIEAGEARYVGDDISGIANLVLGEGLGAWNRLKTDMFWAGFYDPEEPPIIGDASFDMERDLKAINRMLYAANSSYAGADYNLVLEDRKMIAQQLGHPLYDDFDSLSAEDLNVKPTVFYVDPEDPYNQLKDWSKNNGVNIGSTFLETNADRIQAGLITIDDVKQEIREKYIAPRFPAWTNDIMNGSDIADLSMPYREAAARILEQDIDAIDINNPLIVDNLTTFDDKGNITFTPLHKFEQQVRQQDEWYQTTEANVKMEKSVNDLLKEFGF